MSLSADQRHEMASDGMLNKQKIRHDIEHATDELVYALQQGFEKSALNHHSYIGYLAIAYGPEVVGLYLNSLDH